MNRTPDLLITNQSIELQQLVFHSLNRFGLLSRTKIRIDRFSADPKFPNENSLFFTGTGSTLKFLNAFCGKRWFTAPIPTLDFFGNCRNVYVITGPVFEPSIAQSQSIGPGQVHVPKYLFKLVYDQDKNRAWAHWQLNDDATRGSKPISYAELVKRTGINFLPGVNPGQ